MRMFFIIPLAAAIATPALAGDAAKGEQVFKACLVCHAIGPNAKNKVGPELNGVVGRKWATIDGFNYSKDLTEGKAAGKVWDEAMLHQYIENPKAVAPRGKMAYAGLKDAAKRDDLIAYLKQFDSAGNKK
jgi:cytochrome c